jgi:hypothetical protein
MTVFCGGIVQEEETRSSFVILFLSNNKKEMRTRVSFVY